LTEQFKEQIGRMTSLAERFASEGQMSLNKLTEAAGYALIRRAGWKYRPLVSKDRMQVELAGVVRELEDSDLSPALLATLRTCLEYLTSGENILLEHAPDVFVCRTCGHAALGQAPDNCPDCGSWPGRFRKFVAFFNGDNQEPINPLTVLDSLEASVAAVKRLTDGLSEEALNRKPSADEWSVRDHMAHFLDTHEMLENRVNLMLEHDDPDLTAYPVFELATKEERHPPTAHGIIETFARKRTALVGQLRALTLNDLFRTGYHPSFGQLTILRQAAYMANHEQDHLSEIEAVPCKNYISLK